MATTWERGIWCVERCGGHTVLRCELEWGAGNHARGGGGKGAREDAAGARLDPEPLLVAMARERSDAQLEGCGACDHAKASCGKRKGDTAMRGQSPCNATTSVSPTRSGSDEEVCGTQGARTVWAARKQWEPQLYTP